MFGSNHSAVKELLSFPWCNIPALSRGTTFIPARIPAGSVDCECCATVDADVLPESFRGNFSIPNVEVQRLNWARALRFFPLTGNVCVEWFGLRVRDSLGTSMRTRLADWVNSMPLTNFGVVDRGGEFEPGSLAKAIDDFLHAEDGLVGEFEMSARQRIDLVEQTRVQSRQAREAGWQKVMQRLGKSVEQRPRRQ